MGYAASEGLAVGVKRSARIDLRLTPADKTVLERIAKAESRTLTSLLQEWIDILVKERGKLPWETK
jgi:hypothetical protein